MINTKYQGQETSRDRSSKTYRETYIGDEASIDAKIATLTMYDYYTGKGYLRSWNKTQDQGTNFNLEIEYGQTYANEYTDEVVSTPKPQLSTRTLQLPLRKNANYLTNWNYDLAAKNTDVVPAWWQTAKTLSIPTADIGKYTWVESQAEVDKENGWKIIAQRTKPGYQYWEVSYFVVVVTTPYRTKEQAGAAINKNINHVFTNFTHDFGLGGQWKLDDAQVSYTGKSWDAVNTYTRAWDYWDPDLYQGGVRPNSSSSGN